MTAATRRSAGSAAAAEGSAAAAEGPAAAVVGPVAFDATPAFDAPEGISKGRWAGRSTHESGTPGADAPTGIAGDPHAPEPSVERAARVFARAFADRLGAVPVGPGQDAESA
jgi:hypothetical protein